MRYWHFRRSPTVWLHVQNGTFRPLGLGVRVDVLIGDRSIRLLANGFLLAPHRQIGSISYRFELFSWLQKPVRPPVHPPARRGCDDKYRSRSHCFVKRKHRLKLPLTRTPTVYSPMTSPSSLTRGDQLTKSTREHLTIHLYTQKTNLTVVNVIVAKDFRLHFN